MGSVATLSPFERLGNLASEYNQRVVRFVTKVDGLDKGFKVLDETLGVAIEAMKAAGNDSRGVDNTNRFIKDTRTGIGFIKAISGVIPSMIGMVMKIINLVKHLFDENTAIVITDKKDLGNKKKQLLPDFEFIPIGKVALKMKDVETNEKKKSEEKIFVYQGFNEKLLGIVSTAFGLLAAAAYFIGFGILRLAGFAYKMSPDRVSASAASMGAAFAPTMVANHFAAAVAIPAEFTREALVSIRQDHSLLTFFSRDAVIKLILQFLIKLGEIGVDIVTVFRVQAHVAVRLTLGLFVALVDAYVVWRETAV